MTILCHDEAHVYLVGATYCTCGGEIAAWDTCPICDQPESRHVIQPNGDMQCPPLVSQVNAPPPHMYGFIGYQPQPAAPKPKAEDVPLSRLKAAVDAKALYLSADGLRAYRDDRGNPEVCFWDAEAGKFDSWWFLDGEVPEDAVRM